MSREKNRTEVTNKLITSRFREVRTLTVAKVVAIHASGLVDVDPQIQLMRRTGGGVDLGRLNEVPIGHFKAGGFIVTLPVEVGTEGLVFFSDRSLDVWKSTGRKAPPDTLRTHDISDAVFVPFPTSDAGVLTQYAPDKMVIGKEDGSAQITINKNDGAVNVESGLKITCTAPDLALEGNTVVTGTLHATGDISSGGQVSGTDFVGPSGIGYEGHFHISGGPGSNSSGIQGS